MRFVALAALCACQAGNDRPAVDAPPARALAAPDAGVDAAIVVDAPPPAPREWLRGSTHVHSNGSGDSTTPVETVIAWYVEHGYDFIVLTDHNVVTPPPVSPDLVVIPGVELTHNPNLCLPRQHTSGRCRVHVNLLGVTAPPVGRFSWANFGTRDRLEMYGAALAKQRELGGLVQLNHPTNYFGMTDDLIVALAERGVSLVEIWNQAFVGWDRAAARRARSSEALWDHALSRGARMWGVATDDAHHYRRDGKYVPGGGWIVVHAHRDQASILAAIAAGEFYASTGVELTHVDVTDGALVIEATAASTFDFIENGKLVESVQGTSARHPLPATGYVRAVVRGRDGARAWTQPRWR